MTTATASQRRVKEIDLFEESVAGLQTLLGEIAAPRGQPPIPTVVVSGPYGLREYVRQTGEKAVYPLMAIMLTTVSESAADGSGMWNKQAMFEGMKIGETSLERDAIVLHAVPVTAEFQITYLCQSLPDVVVFTNRWLFREREAQFKLASETINIGIRVTLARTLTIPQLALEDYGNLYMYETTATINSYVGEIEFVAALKSIVVNTNLVDNNNAVVPGTTGVFTITRRGTTRSGV